MRPTVRERVRYRFDEIISRGTAVLIATLFVVIALAVFVFALIVTLAGGGGPDAPQGFGPLLWHNLMRTFDPGTMADDEGPVLFVVSSLFVTLVGVFVFSTLIGVISAGMETTFERLRKGRSRVIAEGHVVVLGWSQEIFTVLSELVGANENRPRAVIAVLADRDKVDMEEEIAARVGNTKGTRIICRTGIPSDVDDIDIASVQTSRAIVVLSPDTDEPDADVLKTLLAILNDPDRRPEPYHIVGELKRSSNAAAAKLVGREEVELVVADHAIAKIMAQTCRQSGLSVVYTELLNFSGDEFYVASEPTLVGRSFGDALAAFETSTPVGLVDHAGRARLNPAPATPIGADDRLLVIAEDDDTSKARADGSPRIDEDAIVDAESTSPAPERTLFLGWNGRAPQIVRELDAYVADGSEIAVVSDVPGAEADASRLERSLTRSSITFTHADPSDPEVLDAIGMERLDHVVVLSSIDDADVQHADARTLSTLIHLRDIATRTGAAFSITTEMIDPRNRTLGEVAKPDDFIISNHIVSLLLAQIAEHKALGAVFEDLFAAEGAEIYLRPIDGYVSLGRPLTFATVVESARRRNEVALGYRKASAASRPDEHYGVVFNPPKSREVTFDEGDRIIVLAEA